MPSYLKEIDEVKRPQPYVLVLGSALEVASSFVIIEKNALPQASLLESIDVCYKAHYVLDCKYEQRCHAAWTFLEKCVYEQQGVQSRDSSTLRALRAFLSFKKVL